jgi:hypothetical protein
MSAAQSTRAAHRGASSGVIIQGLFRLSQADSRSGVRLRARQNDNAEWHRCGGQPGQSIFYAIEMVG